MSLNLKLSDSGNQNREDNHNEREILSPSPENIPALMNIPEEQSLNANINQNEKSNPRNPKKTRTISNRKTETDTRPVHQTIIINPDDEAIQEGFFKNPLKIFRLLEKSPFKDAQIIESRPNFQRKIQVIKVKNTSKTEELLSINKLGDFNIKCSLPQSIRLKAGMIGPITPNDISELLAEQGYMNTKVERFILGKGENARATKTMKIWFQLETLPTHLTIMYQRFEVTPFIERPWQCYKCQQFGHSAKYWKNRDVCLICSGKHNLRECQYKDNIQKRKCANCGENHTSNFNGCRKIQEEKKVQYVKAYQNLSYRDAAITVKDKENMTRIAQLQGNATHSHQTTSQSKEKQPPRTKEVTTQTVNEEIAVECLQKSETAYAEKIALILFEIFNSLNKSDSIQKKCNTITTAVSTHFAIPLNKNQLLNSFKQIGNKGHTNQSQIINSKSVHGISKS